MSSRHVAHDCSHISALRSVKVYDSYIRIMYISQVIWGVHESGSTLFYTSLYATFKYHKLDHEGLMEMLFYISCRNCSVLYIEEKPVTKIIKEMGLWCIINIVADSKESEITFNYYIISTQSTISPLLLAKLKIKLTGAYYCLITNFKQ